VGLWWVYGDLWWVYGDLWWIYGDQWVIYWLVVAPTPLKNDGVKVSWEDKHVEKKILFP